MLGSLPEDRRPGVTISARVSVHSVAGKSIRVETGVNRFHAASDRGRRGLRPPVVCARAARQGAGEGVTGVSDGTTTVGAGVVGVVAGGTAVTGLSTVGAVVVTVVSRGPTLTNAIQATNKTAMMATTTIQ